MGNEPSKTGVSWERWIAMAGLAYGELQAQVPHECLLAGRDFEAQAGDLEVVPPLKYHLHNTATVGP